MPTRQLSIVATAWLALAAGAAAAPPSRPPPAAPTPAAPTPEPPTETAPAPAAAEAETDVDALRKEVDALRDQLFRSRARAAAVASAVYSSRLRVVLGHASGRHQTITRATVRLDGASVFDDSEGAVGKGAAPRFDGFVAPGRHLITIRLEATAKDDDRFTTATESTLVVQVPAGKDVVVTASARDDGDIAYEWKRREAGSYQLGLDVSIATTARPAAGKPASARRPGGSGREGHADRRAAR